MPHQHELFEAFTGDDIVINLFLMPISVLQLSKEVNEALQGMHCKYMGDLVLADLPAHSYSLNGVHAALQRLGLHRHQSVEPQLVARFRRARAILSQPLSALQFSIRPSNALECVDCNRVSDLPTKTDDDLLETPSIGESALREIKEKLALHGLRLNMTFPIEMY